MVCVWVQSGSINRIWLCINNINNLIRLVRVCILICRNDRLTFVVSVIEILILIGKREVSITFYRKWTTTLTHVPAHYGSGRRIQDFSGGGGGGGGGEGVIQVRPGTISG